MDTSLIYKVAIPIVVAILMFAYAGYLWVRQGVHVRGKGWMPKEEAPKTFYFTVVFMILLGISQIIGPVFWLLR